MEIDSQLGEVISRFETNQPIEVYITGVEPVDYENFVGGIELKFYDICRLRNELLVRVDCQFIQADQIAEKLIYRLYETLDANPFLCSQLPNNFRAKYAALYKSIVGENITEKDKPVKSVDRASSTLNRIITDLANFQLALYSERFADWWNETRLQLSFNNTIQSFLKWLLNPLKMIVFLLVGMVKITYEILQIIARIIPSDAHWLGKKHIRVLFTIYFPNNIEKYPNLKEQIGSISTNKNAAFIIFSRESDKTSISDNGVASPQKTINIYIHDIIDGTVIVGDNNQTNSTEKNS